MLQNKLLIQIIIVSATNFKVLKNESKHDIYRKITK